jgi:hypothetical protein
MYVQLKIAFIVAFFMNYPLSWSQTPDPRFADDLFKKGNFLAAIPEYKKHLKLESKSEKALTNLALCYLNSNLDKSAAIKYLERAKELEKKDKEVLYYLALAYTHGNNYSKAIETLKEYQKEPGKHIEEIPNLIENYTIALDMINKPINVLFQNMGPFINSEFPDYNPFVTKDEKTLVFTSRRKEGKGPMEFDGYYSSDVYVCSFDGLKFSGAKNSGSLNSIYDEQCVGIYDDGAKIFVYIDNFATGERGNIYEAERKGPIYSKKKKIQEGVNTKYLETSTSISSDGTAFIYASNRSGGSGGLDIYMTKQLPDGIWATPQNLSTINTPQDEDFPTLSPDGQTLYFCSNGRIGMGGFDLYKSKWDEEKMEWGHPENLGYPLNTSYDEKTISFADDEKHAYITAVREEGFGDLDLYRITFEEIEVREALYTVEIIDLVSNAKVKDGVITAFMDNIDDPRIFISNKNTGEITMILDPGTYELEIEADDYELKIVKLVVSEFDADQGVIKKLFKLSK